MTFCQYHFTNIDKIITLTQSIFISSLSNLMLSNPPHFVILDLCFRFNIDVFLIPLS